MKVHYSFDPTSRFDKTDVRLLIENRDFL